MRIGVFGGTFNPPHNGHIILGNDFKEQLELDKLLVIPTYIPPHKVTPFLASSEDRVNMCKIMFEPIGYEIDTIEIERGGKSYTHDTLHELKNKYDNPEIFLAMGSDMFFLFDKWKKPEEILSLCTICVATREHEKTRSEFERYAMQKFPEYYKSGHIRILNCNPLEISSTEIREMIKNKENTDRYIPEELRSYIDKRGLYR